MFFRLRKYNPFIFLIYYIIISLSADISSYNFKKYVESFMINAQNYFMKNCSRLTYTTMIDLQPSKD